MEVKKNKKIHVLNSVFTKVNKCYPCLTSSEPLILYTISGVYRYKGLLFGDISAVCGFKRVEYLKDLLDATVSVHLKMHQPPPCNII